MDAAGPLRVVLDDRPLRRTLTGIGNYIDQLLRHAPQVAPDVEIDPFVFTHLSRRSWRETLADRERQARREEGSSTEPRDVRGSRVPWWVRRGIQAGYATCFRFKTRGRYDLYHEPNHVPIASDLPTVTTIHDLSVLVHPEWHPADRVRWYEAGFARGVRQTRRFIAASQFTKCEMVERLGVPAERIDVTYQAPRPAFGPQTPEHVAHTRRELDAPGSFFLYVGTLEPRKNVTGLLDAYAALPDAIRISHPLLIAGAWGWKAEALTEKLSARRLSKHVRLLGYLHDPQLAGLYAACTALVWPTFYEGFGLPPLEAMACGAAVIVSDTASLPEVVGDAGVLLDPNDGPAWTDAMRRAAEDDAWRSEQSTAGMQRAAAFSWERCVRETIACYRAALEV